LKRFFPGYRWREHPHNLPEAFSPRLHTPAWQRLMAVYGRKHDSGGTGAVLNVDPGTAVEQQIGDVTVTEWGRHHQPRDLKKRKNPTGPSGLIAGRLYATSKSSCAAGKSRTDSSRAADRFLKWLQNLRSGSRAPPLAGQFAAIIGGSLGLSPPEAD
jgi:hypothetical protein